MIANPVAFIYLCNLIKRPLNIIANEVQFIDYLKEIKCPVANTADVVIERNIKFYYASHQQFPYQISIEM